LAITDDTLKGIANLEESKLTFLDISYCKQVTDDGFTAFEGKTHPITHLVLNSLANVSSNGLQFIVASCTKTLRVFEAALNDQEMMVAPDFGKALSTCFDVESIDIGGCRGLGDDFFTCLTAAEIVVEGNKVKPGLQSLHTLKMNFLIRISDMAVQKVVQACPKLEHLEIAGCEKLTDLLITKICEGHRPLVFIDINHIPVVTPALYENLKNLRPELTVRRYLFTEVDPKDNMLRVPLRIVEKKKGGKKKKKKKK